jgi:hypothetical protein
MNCVGARDRWRCWLCQNPFARKTRLDFSALVFRRPALPLNTTVVQASAPTGNVAVGSSTFTWNVPVLPAGSNVTLEVTLRFNNGGWQANQTWALPFEVDPVANNNFASLPLYVELPPDGWGCFALNFSGEDLINDPVRNRLLLSVELID